jgi:tRNA threonylcarbamoyladenosine biosynthesis protein TsaB
MYILAIETTGAEASIAIINEQGEVREETSTQKLSHLQNLMPMLDLLLEKCRLTIGDMSVVAVSEGPGSFTGIRIGVSTARALAQALGIGTIGVPTLQTFAYHVPDYQGVICPIFDARRSQVYGGAFRWIEGNCMEVAAGDAYDLSALLEQLKFYMEELNESDRWGHEITFFGDGIDPYKEKILEWQHSSLKDNIRILFAPDDRKLQKASSVAKLALEKYKLGDIKPYIQLKPVYMRKAEAERKLEEKS